MVIASQADGAVMVFPIAEMDQMKSTVYLPLQQVSLLQDQVHFQHQPQAQSQFLKVAKKINSNAKMENASTWGGNVMIFLTVVTAQMKSIVQQQQQKL